MDTQPVRVQLSRAKGWRMPANTVKVDRTTPLGNPFVVGQHGCATRCVEMYRDLMLCYVCATADNTDAQTAAWRYVETNRDALRGKNLACWCALGDPCHADVLLEIVNGAQC